MVKNAIALACWLGIASYTSAAGLYPSSSNVLQVNANSYSRLIERSNYTSVVEFYAPWCGHCKNLAPAYEKAATSLKGLANVASVNCDEDENKPFCGQMGVQGFPTLKLVKPSRDGKRKSPSVTDYQGPREAKAIIEAVKDKMNNHVTRVKDDNLDKFLNGSPSKPKALFYSEKGLVPPLVKALAIDFLGSVDVGYVRNSDQATVAKFKVAKFPSVVLIPGSGPDHILYDGEFKKPALLKFMSEIASPNPDANKADTKGQTKKPTSKPSKAAKKEAPSKASESIVNDGSPLASPGPEVVPDEKPVQLPVIPIERITNLETESDLQKACLHSGASTCILAITPTGYDTVADTTLAQLGEIAHKHLSRGAKIFPFYKIDESNPGATLLVNDLKLESTASSPSVVAINAKRGWWSRFDGGDSSQAALERWIDSIRFGEISKSKLPPSLITQAVKDAAQSNKEEADRIRDEL